MTRLTVAIVLLAVTFFVGIGIGMASTFGYAYYSGWYGGSCALIDSMIAKGLVVPQSRCTNVQRYPFLATPTVPTPATTS